MPSLLVLAGIMEKNGELAVSGFGSEGLHVPPDEEEDDSRALRVALGQLSLLGLGEAEDGGGGSPATGSQDRSNNNNHHSSSSIGGGSAGDTGLLTGKNKLCVLYEAATSETKGRGSNITECVPVPSSEHVAEIVGRQGCKIKALRAKTNTYIKTPLGGSFNGSPPAPLPGQTTIQVRVPYRVVGLVVGPKGSTIKRIQQQTCTYIVTPSRDRDPVFEITGSPGNAERAREEIESHIAFRTGGLHDLNNENDCLGSEAGGERRDGGAAAAAGGRWGRRRREEEEGGAGIYGKSDYPSAGQKTCSYIGLDGAPCWGGDQQADYAKQAPAYYPQQRSKSFGGLPLPLAPALAPAWASPAARPRPPHGHAQARRAHSEPIAASMGFPGRLARPVPGDSPPAASRECMTCFESKVTAALVPCGHNLFCMECAIRVCQLGQPECPFCQAPVTQAIRIFS
ncbi:hypothetical protein SKAU_G00408250 [Synaphobranchus kaupii]|uniref:RING-type domain-containing protein n=1 Tax=Synaphobranchus kaupii TaxID=118154 RepID=A0A9Q1EAH7_SYNKA|nr:hypothetical protein SKAU_G00408250 [Synaphobranchus kaupii]